MYVCKIKKAWELCRVTSKRKVRYEYAFIMQGYSDILWSQSVVPRVGADVDNVLRV